MNYRPYYIVRNFDNLPSSKATTLGSFLALSLACYLAFFVTTQVGITLMPPIR